LDDAETSHAVTQAGMPRVLHVTTVHTPFDTRIFQKEVRSLAAAGYDVRLATNVRVPECVDGISLIPLQRAGSSGDGRLVRIPKNVRALREMLRDYDLIHIHDPELLINAAICLILGRRVIYDVHEFYHERMLDAHWIPAWLRPLVKAAYTGIERVLLPRLSGVVLVSDDMLPHYRRYVRPQRLAVVKNYPNITPEQHQRACKAASPLAEPYIIHTGGVSRLRAFDIMVAAAEQLRLLGSRAPIVNIGAIDLSAFSTPEQTALLARAQRADVRMLGRVDFEESLSWIAHARIGYMPLVFSANNARGMPQKMFEYFRFGLPTVACDFGIVRDIINAHHAGVLVPHDVPALHAAALQKLLCDDAWHSTLAASARNAGAHYSFSAEFKNLVSLYQAVLGTR